MSTVDVHGSRLRFDVKDRPYTLSVASSRAERLEAYGLVRRLYQDAGYLDASSDLFWYSLHDALPQTVTLVIRDDTGTIVASGTMIPDSPLGLPMERMYAHEVQRLRSEGRRVCEINRLVATDRSFKGGRLILMHLFRACYYYARDVLKADDWLCVVSPGHAKFYRHYLLSQDIGGRRADPECQDAASIALDVDIRAAEARYRQRQQMGRDRLGLCDFFLPPSREADALSRFVRRLPTSMTPVDLHYFLVEARPLLREAPGKALRYLNSLYPDLDFAAWLSSATPSLRVRADTRKEGGEMIAYDTLVARNSGFIPEHVQRKIRETRLLIAGCGIGSTIAETAVRTGFEHIVLADGDIVEEHNLNRQCYIAEDVGHAKVSSLARRLKRINPAAQVTEMNAWITTENVGPIVAQADLVLDTIDLLDLAAVVALHDEAHAQGKPLISAVSAAFGAAAMFFPPDGPVSFREVFDLPLAGPVDNKSYIQRFAEGVERLSDKLDPSVMAVLGRALTFMANGTPCPAPQVAVGAATVGALAVTIAVKWLQEEPIKSAPEMIVSDLFSATRISAPSGYARRTRKSA
jgi:molybdopterin/thiamine biosynthesis adenylyltransferase